MKTVLLKSNQSIGIAMRIISICYILRLIEALGTDISSILSQGVVAVVAQHGVAIGEYGVVGAVEQRAVFQHVETQHHLAE